MICIPTIKAKISNFSNTYWRIKAEVVLLLDTDADTAADPFRELVLSVLLESKSTVVTVVVLLELLLMVIAVSGEVGPAAERLVLFVLLVELVLLVIVFELVLAGVLLVKEREIPGAT